VDQAEPNPLTSELREAESLMEQALAEACEAEPPSKVDTGELIRIEEMLEIATDAARQAVALRRERGETRKRSRARGSAEIGAAEAAASEGETHRAITDERGVRWDVYAVYPEARLSPKLRGTFQHGWLCFDSGSEKRRHSPIPDDWQKLDGAELKRLVDAAERARPRRERDSGDEPSPPGGERPGAD
jgi:hypothetical protein